MKSLIQKFWPVGVIIGLWFIFSLPFFLKGLVPFPSIYQVSFFPPWNAQYGMPVKNNAMPDIISQIFPWKKLTIDTWKSGAIPLWNPYSFSGTANAGNYQTAVFSPFNLLFLILSQTDAWSVLVLLQPLLAGLFMYIFVQSLDRSCEASLLTAIAFMFCGFIVVWMGYATLGYAALFLPIICWGIRKKQKWAITFGVTLSLVSGHFQISIYVISAVVAYILWTKQWRLLFYVLLGILIAAPQLLLTFHTYENSIRSSSFVKGEIIPWSYLVTFFAPDFFGNPVTRNDWFGHYAEWSGYIGVLPLMLAFYGIISQKNKQKWFFVVLAIISLLFALPTPLNNVLYWMKIPVLSTSAASRVIILTSFSLCVLAGFGFDAMQDDWKNKNWARILWFIIGTLCILGIVWIMAFLVPLDKASIAKHNLFLPSMIVVTGTGLFFLGLFKHKIIRVMVIAGFILLTSIDLLRFAEKWIPFDPKVFVFPTMNSITFLTKTIGNNRVFGNFGNELSSYFHIFSLEGYDAVYQARYGEFISAASDGTMGSLNRSVVLLDKNGQYTEDILELLGARYNYYRKSDGRNIWTFPFWKYPSYRNVYSDDIYEVWENPDAFPRAFLASSYMLATGKKEILNTIFSAGFNRRDSLVLEQKPIMEPASGSGNVTIRTYEPTHIVIQTSSDVPKLLFLSDVYDSGWQAKIDGVSSPIYRADYDFRAMSVSAGTHTVEFSYAPSEFYWGILWSIIGIVVFVVL